MSERENELQTLYDAVVAEQKLTPTGVEYWVLCATRELVFKRLLQERYPDTSVAA